MTAWWFRSYRVDPRPGEVQAEFTSHARDAHDLEPIGDGSWPTTHPTGHPVRWADA
ncbi:hypothetical protein JCM9957A_20070 [Kineosporia succinea]